jgi:hypothetical protein
MRRILTALLSAGAICAFTPAAPALAQTFGVVPYGVTYAGSSPTIASNTGTPAYSWENKGPWAAPGGECQIISGNHVCTANSGFGPLAFGALGYGL